MNTPRTEIVSVHKVRLFARSRERRLTARLAAARARSHPTAMIRLEDAGQTFLVESWTRGFRVRKAGRLMFVVEATDWVGH